MKPIIYNIGHSTHPINEFIDDALIIRKIKVEDIRSKMAGKPHTLTSSAKVVGSNQNPGRRSLVTK